MSRSFWKTLQTFSISVAESPVLLESVSIVPPNFANLHRRTNGQATTAAAPMTAVPKKTLLVVFSPTPEISCQPTGYCRV
jgi:hypothetical protein